MTSIEPAPKTHDARIVGGHGRGPCLMPRARCTFKVVRLLDAEGVA
jgi:hypothetical protein